MTSRNYLFNSIKENIRRNFYLLILLSVSMLAVLPAYTIMQMELAPLQYPAMGSSLNVDFSLFRPLEFFVDPKNGDGRNNNPPAMRVRVDCYTKKLPFRVQ